MLEKDHSQARLRGHGRLSWGDGLFAMAFQPNEVCGYKGAVHMSLLHTTQIRIWIWFLTQWSCVWVAAGGPFRQLGLNTCATHGLAGIPLENPQEIGNLLKREAQINFSCQRSNCLIQELKIPGKALTYCLKNKATVPNKEGGVPGHSLCVWT